jgi:hypothetical protein
MFLASWVMRRRRSRNEKNITRNGCAAGSNTCVKEESDNEQNIQVVEILKNDPAKASVGQHAPSFPPSAENIVSRSETDAEEALVVDLDHRFLLRPRRK